MPITAQKKDSDPAQKATPGSGSPNRIGGSEPRAAPNALIANTESPQVVESIRAVGVLLNAATEFQKIVTLKDAGSSERRLDLCAQARHEITEIVRKHLPAGVTDWDGTEVGPVGDLASIEQAKGGPDVRAIRYIGFLVEKEKAMADKVIQAIGEDKFKKKINDIYKKLPLDERAFSTEEEDEVRKQLKDYLP